MPTDPISDIRDLASRTEDVATLRRLVGYACELAEGYADLLDCPRENPRFSKDLFEYRIQVAVTSEEESEEGPEMAVCPHCLGKYDPASMTALPDGTEVCDCCYGDFYGQRADGKIVRKE